VDRTPGLAGVTSSSTGPSGPPLVRRLSDGAYLIQHDGRHEVVYATGPAGDRWIFWNGHTYRIRARGNESERSPEQVRGHRAAATQLTAPMPARIVRINARVGAPVEKGETLVVLEAMKMELPIRAPDDATVAAVHCSEGELVQAEAPLVDLT
jgi:3-methylcrotonyl-CoA carboxylase alpha subunit